MLCFYCIYVLNMVVAKLNDGKEFSKNVKYFTKLNYNHGLKKMFHSETTCHGYIIYLFFLKNNARDKKSAGKIPALG